MIKSLALPLFALALPFAANAQEVTGSVTFGYASNDMDRRGLSTDGFGIDGHIGLTFGNGWSLGVAAERSAQSIEGENVDIVRQNFALNVAYTFANGAWAGAYLEEFSFGYDVAPVSMAFSDFGLEAGGKVAGIDLAGYVSVGGNFDSYGLSAAYQQANYAVAASYGSTESDEFYFGSLERVGVAGTYQFSPAFGAFVGIQNVSGNDFEANEYGVGATYSYTGAQLPVIASIEFGRVSFEDLDQDTVRVGLSIPFGKSSTFVPTTSVASEVFSPSKNIFSYVSSRTPLFGL